MKETFMIYIYIYKDVNIKIRCRNMGMYREVDIIPVKVKPKKNIHTKFAYMWPTLTKGTMLVIFEILSYCFQVEEDSITFKMIPISKLYFKKWFCQNVSKSHGWRQSSWENGLRRHKSVLKIIWKLNKTMDFRTFFLFIE